MLRSDWFRISISALVLVQVGLESGKMEAPWAATAYSREISVIQGQ